jgi:hypothetical protein
MSDRVRDDGSSAGLQTTWQCPSAVTIAPVTIAFVHAKLGAFLVCGRDVERRQKRLSAHHLDKRVDVSAELVASQRNVDQTQALDSRLGST